MKKNLGKKLSIIKFIKTHDAFYALKAGVGLTDLLVGIHYYHLLHGEDDPVAPAKPDLAAGGTKL